MSHRHEQLESTLKRALQQVLGRGLQDPRAGGLITLTSLTITQDLKTATALVSVYPEARLKLTLHALRHAAAHLRREAAELVQMKQMPHLVFEPDTKLGKDIEVVQALRKVSDEREAKGGDPDAREAGDS